MKKTMLTINQFTYSAPTAGTSSKVLSYLIPLNSYIILRSDQMMKLRFTEKQVFNYTAAQTSKNVTVTVSGSVAQVGTVFGTDSNPQLSAIGYWNATSPSAFTKVVQPTSISGSEITFAVNDTTSVAANFTVFYLLANGSFSWVVSVPVAAGDVTAQIYGDSLQNVNVLNQTSQESSLYFPEQIVLPQGFALDLYVQSTPAVDMDPALSSTTPNSLAGIQIPVITGPMSEILEQDPDVKKHVIEQLLG